MWGYAMMMFPLTACHLTRVMQLWAGRFSAQSCTLTLPAGSAGLVASEAGCDSCSCGTIIPGLWSTTQYQLDMDVCDVSVYGHRRLADGGTIAEGTYQSAYRLKRRDKPPMETHGKGVNEGKQSDISGHYKG